MADKVEGAPPVLAAHGAAALPRVRVDAYNAELRDAEGFIGDRASKRAFRALLDDWRERLRRFGEDPLGEEPSDTVSKKTLDSVLESDDLEAIGVVHGAIEDFAQILAGVVRRLLRLKSWQDTQRIVIGGGFRQSRIGELTIGRTAVLLKAGGLNIELKPITHHPDEAGLIGAVHLAPSWIFTGHDALLALDIGGTNIRVGVVEPALAEADDLSACRVRRSSLWRHADDKPGRERAVERLVDMIEEQIARARKDKLRLAPFIGIACPGAIGPDGSIERGGQNLPGNWESSRFNLPQRIREAIATIDGHATAVVMHNDAVVQGLSEAPFMGDVKRWGVL
ncbi:MAG: ROK family protein, partial [Rhodospirillaceae bacterium]|nr:ROK family protein [Rhodospirillaceae bacterium]